jgi:hypothetical protein
LLERGLRDLLNDSSTDNGLDAEAIIALLARQPTPEQILAIQPSATLQSRVSELLVASKAGTLPAAVPWLKVQATVLVSDLASSGDDYRWQSELAMATTFTG